MNELCDCVHWARSIDLKHLTNHHPKCLHYNDSLIDVWRMSDGTTHCYFGTEADARQAASVESEDPENAAVTVTCEKMHREVFESLPEFEGF